MGFLDFLGAAKDKTGQVIQAAPGTVGNIVKQTAESAFHTFNFLNPTANITQMSIDRQLEQAKQAAVKVGNVKLANQITQKQDELSQQFFGFKKSASTGTKIRSGAADVISTGANLAAPGIGGLAEKGATAVFGFLAPKVVERVVANAAAKTALGVGGELIPKGVNTALRFATGPVAGAAINAPFGAANAVGNVTQPLTGGSLLRSTAESLPAGAGLGLAGEVLHTGGKGAREAQRGSQAEVGAIGPGVRSVFSPDDFKKLASAGDENQVRGLLKDRLPQEAIDRVAGPVALAKDAPTVERIINSSTPPNVSASVTDRTSPYAQLSDSNKALVEAGRKVDTAVNYGTETDLNTLTKPELDQITKEVSLKMDRGPIAQAVNEAFAKIKREKAGNPEVRSNTITPIKQEALKYKSADEFIKALGESSTSMPELDYGRRLTHAEQQLENDKLLLSSDGEAFVLPKEKNLIADTKKKYIDIYNQAHAEAKPGNITSLREATYPQPEQTPAALPEGSIPNTKVQTVSKAIDITKPQPQLAPGERQRGLYKTTSEAPQLTEQARTAAEKIQPQGYTPIGINPTLDKARQVVATNFDNAKRIANDALDAGKWNAESSSLTIALIEKASKEGADEELQQILAKAGPLATQSGQANVLWRTLANTVDPERMVKFANKLIDQANEKRGLFTKAQQKLTGQGAYTLGRKTKQYILDNMAKARALPDGAEKDAIIKDVLDKINERIPPGASELFDAYRYQNLLSNPRTHARNTVSNLFNTMITRPAALATRASTDWFASTLFGKERQNYLKEVPQYYKGLINSIGDAFEASKNAFKDVGSISNLDLNDLKALGQASRDIHGNKLAKPLTAITRAMEAQDRFFQTLISAGEYAAQRSKGIEESIARKEAENVAQYSLFRSEFDPKNKTGQGALLSKIDQVSSLITKIGQEHKSFRWFVPFVRTTMNVSKQFVEFSPYGFSTLYKASGPRRQEQLAKALLGSTVAAVGAKFALDGNATWSAPTNAKEREAFYAAGKKPYSIKIGDKWVPMIYFGPFGLSLGLGAAVRDANDHSPLTDNQVQRLTKIMAGQAKFFGQQTYVQGLSNLIDIASGNTDANVGQAIGQLATQAIPLSGLFRYVSGIIDPVVRKSTNPVEAVESGLPGVSKNLKPYTNPEGQPETRNITDWVLPYTLGTPGKGAPQAKREAYLDFQTTIGRTSALRTSYADKIKEAIQSNDLNQAVKLARDYNTRYSAAFDDWRTQHGQYRSDKQLAKAYLSGRITDNSLSRWLTDIKKAQAGGG